MLAVFAAGAGRCLGCFPDLVPLALGRDGTVLGEAVRRLGSPVADARLSRTLLAVAAIDGPGDHENLLNLLVRMRHRPATWSEAAAVLDVPPPDARGDSALAGEEFPRFLRWLERPEARTRLEARAASLRAAILTHLDRAGVVAGAPLLLLDVGYAANVQRCLRRVLALAGRPAPVHGLYLITSAGARHAMAEGEPAEGVLAHLGEPADFAATALRHRDVLECLLAQPAGELEGYDAAGTPLCAPSPLSPRQMAEADALQRTALDHAAGLAGDPAAARAALQRLLLEPTTAEADLMGRWVHADSTALDGVRRLDDGPPDGDRAATLWPAAARLRLGRKR